MLTTPGVWFQRFDIIAFNGSLSVAHCLGYRAKGTKRERVRSVRIAQAVLGKLKPHGCGKPAPARVNGLKISAALLY
jgi:hypothetical protein